MGRGGGEDAELAGGREAESGMMVAAMPAVVVIWTIRRFVERGVEEGTKGGDAGSYYYYVGFDTMLGVSREVPQFSSRN